MRRTAALIAVASALLLAGCSMLPFGNDDPSSGGSQGEGGSGGQTGGTDGSGNGDDPAGDDSVSTGQLPADWPPEVHVPDGEVLTAVSSPGYWVAQIGVDDAGAAFEEVAIELEAAGFTALAETTGQSSGAGERRQRHARDLFHDSREVTKKG